MVTNYSFSLIAPLRSYFVNSIEIWGENFFNSEYKLNKRITLPDDCKLDTLDVVCDKKRTVVRIVCDKIPGHSRCMSRNSRTSRLGSALGFYDQPRSGLATPNMFAPA